jgi:2,4-dienoyl-CoA reductase-like NADH-dependent reductase (Old Yellow Enzyme family)
VSDGTLINHPETFEELKPETPRALETDEVPTYVKAYRAAAANAMACGFDGVEVPAGNGFLVRLLCAASWSFNALWQSYSVSLSVTSRLRGRVLDALMPPACTQALTSEARGTGLALC